MSNTLPAKCPECNEIADWIWQDKETFDEVIVQEAKCSKCGTQFEETMQVTSWSRKAEQDEKEESMLDQVHTFLLETDLMKYAQENVSKENAEELDKRVLDVLQAVEDLETKIKYWRENE